MSNIYISVDPESRDDYLAHGFKYIKKYYVNGKPRYVYASKKGHDVIKNTINSAANHVTNAYNAGFTGDFAKTEKETNAASSAVQVGIDLVNKHTVRQTLKNAGHKIKSKGKTIVRRIRRGIRNSKKKKRR